MHFVSNDKKEQRIEDNVERETSGARKCVEDTKTAMKQAQKYMKNAGNVQFSTRKPDKTFLEMLNVIGDGQSDHASSDDGKDLQDEEDDEEDTDLGKVSEDVEPGWVMCTISRMVQHSMERFRQSR